MKRLMCGPEAIYRRYAIVVESDLLAGGEGSGTEQQLAWRGLEPGGARRNRSDTNRAQFRTGTLEGRSSRREQVPDFRRSLLAEHCLS
jgi:hypothetical protein